MAFSIEYLHYMCYWVAYNLPDFFGMSLLVLKSKKENNPRDDRRVTDLVKICNFYSFTGAKDVKLCLISWIMGEVSAQICISWNLKQIRSERRLDNS